MKVRDRLQFRCYIDESGDEGFVWGDRGHSSRWFVMAAVLVESMHDLEISGAVDRINSRLDLKPSRPLHWKDRRRHEQRRVIMDEIAREPLTIFCVAVHKPSLHKPYLQSPPALYHYTTRYLLERVSWCVDDAGGEVDLVFENRATISYQQLEAYIREVQATADNQLRDVFRHFRTVPRNQRKMLQVADACAGAAFAALEPHRYGFAERSYVDTLHMKFYRSRGNGKVAGYGFKVFPHDVVHSAEYAWIKSL